MTRPLAHRTPLSPAASRNTGGAHLPDRDRQQHTLAAQPADTTTASTPGRS